ncbi:hypothetical protein BCE75_11939 [Isoptericola sp. CG 20/1183]|uniref:Uncharacterized protein n=1 Tax=Isoptericola halotolerans TaxID=300560 RepID=A0ABX5EBB7_9MICO|nr:MULTISPECIES: hypothetical protein [Isoptericola]MCK0115937.1 hypothetical protein [Isoptericola sp. S6320L]PRZ02582.1 hypothetical protein BCE75_11939 [Isoptericola sp. CG 20/1183]PRZ02863.1 hypothetical protein BCL65_11739 [Isoptericola halotolerans]
MSQDAEASHASAPDRPEPPLAPLDGLEEIPTDEHVARFEAVHDRLRARLDDGPAHEAGG